MVEESAAADEAVGRGCWPGLLAVAVGRGCWPRRLGLGAVGRWPKAEPDQPPPRRKAETNAEAALEEAEDEEEERMRLQVEKEPP